MNICHNCKNFDKCVFDRYNGNKPKGVQKYEVDKNVIYVHKCKNYLARTKNKCNDINGFWNFFKRNMKGER